MSLQQSRGRLHGVYDAKDRAELVAKYDQWADSYDSDVTALGYTNLIMVFGLAARYLRPEHGPVLDAGAGTGLLGELMAGLAFTDLTALDMSEGMLAKARARGCYADLRVGVLGEALDFADGQFAGCVGSGVFTVGHAPKESFADLARVVRPGGPVILSLRVDTDSQGYQPELARLEEKGTWRLVERTVPVRSFVSSPEDSHILCSAFCYRVELG